VGLYLLKNVARSSLDAGDGARKSAAQHTALAIDKVRLIGFILGLRVLAEMSGAAQQKTPNSPGVHVKGLQFSLPLANDAGFVVDIQDRQISRPKKIQTTDHESPDPNKAQCNTERSKKTNPGRTGNGK
jgi:hypothetical protein